MELIDAILYINLEHRTDRNEHILAEIAKICQDPSKIHRIDAIKCDPGALGCGLSHIKALQYALSHWDWHRVLVLEDDFTFKDDTDIKSRLAELMYFHMEMDMGLLSYNPNRFQTSRVIRDQIHRVVYSQTTSSYVIARTYIPTLIRNMKESTMDMQLHGKRHENCLDIHWTLLQPKGNWYAIVPAIGYQYDNYSDIEGQHTAYGC
uniref:Glycosyltransferase n=1 Tax=viral metagenome TaxID=1070528 RepID=A0A6C0KWT7_9ZZZZ